MNAFDLIAFTCGKILNNMFEVGSKGKTSKLQQEMQRKTQFCSNHSYDKIIQDIKQAFLDIGASVIR